MSTKTYCGAKEITELFDVSRGYAYKLIRDMNKELKEQGFMTISGKVPVRFLEKKWYGLSDNYIEGNQANV